MVIPVSRRLDFDEVPIIDLAIPKDRDLIESVRRACQDVGFFYIANHGIESPIIDSLAEAAKTYFAVDDTVKSKLLINHQMRGYLPLRYRSYEGESRAGTSHQEGFWVGHEHRDKTNPLDGPNLWPENPSLKGSMQRYHDKVEKLSKKLLTLFALALNQSEDYFDARFTQPNSRLKLNHYPPQLNPQKENNIGVVPHSDSGCFTILWQDDNGGLEILNQQDEWVGAPPIKDTFVVNIGNIMQYWSNGAFSSTPHRVINRNNCDRYSIPYFVNPDFNTEISALLDSEDASFEPFHYGKYQVDLWRRTFPIAKIP